MEMGRLVGEATVEAGAKKIPPLIQHLLDRLQKEFSEESSAFGPNPITPSKSYFKPLDKFEARYAYSDGQPRGFHEGTRRNMGQPPGQVLRFRSNIDAAEGTPLVYNNEGI